MPWLIEQENTKLVKHAQYITVGVSWIDIVVDVGWRDTDVEMSWTAPSAVVSEIRSIEVLEVVLVLFFGCLFTK